LHIFQIKKEKIKMLELVLKTPIEDLIPKLIEFNNTEIIKELAPKLLEYKNKTYTHNEITEAKTDRANLNKFSKAVEDWRKNIKKTYLEPYEKFENQVKEIVNLINESTIAIDTQVKTFEDTQKEKKKQEILDFFNSNIGQLQNLISFEKLFDERYLNATFSINKVGEDLINKINTINSDIKVINDLKFKQESHLIDYYLNCLNLGQTLQEKIRIEEQEKKIVELGSKMAQNSTKDIQPSNLSQNEVKCLDFRIWATNEQIKLLQSFLIDNNIKYGKVK